MADRLPKPTIVSLYDGELSEKVAEKAKSEAGVLEKVIKLKFPNTNGRIYVVNEVAYNEEAGLPVDFKYYEERFGYKKQEGKDMAKFMVYVSQQGKLHGTDDGIYFFRAPLSPSCENIDMLSDKDIEWIREEFGKSHPTILLPPGIIKKVKAVSAGTGKKDILSFKV